MRKCWVICNDKRYAVNRVVTVSLQSVSARNITEQLVGIVSQGRCYDILVRGDKLLIH